MKDANKHARSMNIAKAIDAVVENVIRLPGPEVLNEFQRLETDLLKDIHDEHELLETRRRIAEARISMLSQKDIPISQFDRAWRDMEELGFSNTEREASMTFFRAQFLLENCTDKSLVRHALDRLNSIAEQFESEGLDDLAKHFSKSHMKLLVRFNR